MVVGTDTRTYEGRGFYTMGAHTGGHNADSIGIALIGDFTSIVPSETIQQKIRDTIDCAIQEVNSIPRSVLSHKKTPVF